MIPLGAHRRVPIFPIVVYALVALNVLVFVQELNAPNTDTFINAFAAIPYDIVNGITLAAPSPSIPALTLVTSMFLHGSILHIFFNMLFLLVFGPDIEFLCGHVRFLVFYLVCGLAGGIAQVSIDPGSHIPAIGASGAIAGVLGAYLVRFPFRLPAALVIGLWAIVQFVHGFGAISTHVASEAGGTAYFAHIGGFCAGVLLVGVFAIRPGVARAYTRYW